MQSQFEGTLNVKRGRKKKMNREDHETKLNEIEAFMEVDNVVGNTTEQNLVDVDTANLSKDTITSGEQLEQNDAILDTINMIVRDIDEVTDNIDNTVMQTLGCSGDPIDIQLAADFEDLPVGSLCDISMNTLSDVDMVPGFGDKYTVDTAGDIPQNESQTVTRDASINDAIMNDAIMNDASINDASINDASINNASINDASINDASINNASINNASINDASINDASINDASINDASINDASINDASINDASINDASISDSIAKRKRGRPKMSKDADVKRLKNEELVKLLPEEGGTVLSKEASKTFREILKRKKRLHCPREGCGKKYTCFKGFEYHVVRCGISVTLVAPTNFICDHCGKVYHSAPGLSYHKRTAHDNIKETQETTETEIGLAKSKYTLRQRDETESKSYVEKPVENDSDSSFDGSERPSVTMRGTGWMKYAEKLEDEPADEPEEMKTELTNMTAMTEALRHKKMLKCSKDCGRYFKTASATYQHVKNCKGKEKHRCKLCGRIFLSRSGLRTHIITLHRRKEHNSDDGEESEFSESEEKTVPLKRRFPGKKFDFKESTKTWYKEFLSEASFTCWRPSLKHWNRLSASEAQSYLPVRKMSPVFRIEAVKGKGSTPELEKEYQLPLFTSAPVNSAANLLNITFNVGGSVWAMDWVPVPVDDHDEDCDQYIAVGCHSDPDKTHLLSECYREKGVLQIWRVPHLQNKTRPTEKAEFSFGIVYDYGPLWDIRWCPSRAWDKSSPQTGELRRLGLLALACADGKVRIFSVPFPGSLLENDAGTDSESSPENSLYRVVPHLVLSPGSLCRKYRDECGAAWKLSWQPIYGHKKIIASYTDGTVAVWDLETKNPVLKSTSEDGLTERVFPISHFQAHDSVIRSLAWCPSEPNYIATGGYDRLIKIWDLRHHSQPVLCFAKALSYHLTWPMHLGILLYNTDSMNRVKGTRCLDYYASSRSEKYSGHVTFSYVSQNASAWDNDYSNWINVVAGVDAAGAISINHLTPALAQKNRKNVKVPLFRALFEPTTEHQDPTISAEDLQNKAKETNEEYPFKIVFKDIHPFAVNRGGKYPLFDDEAFVMPNQPTHTALHKVRWNPNFSSYYWLATGGQSGLVRLCYIN
ncbi:uncharacterized protein LOC114530729 isoform X2 [Dendronephthya gigantea]|uniref:uncharacterized protein LOC114530729 isoform X2 n=1 Tax=Dendronephthya gigantea TaxID=151771 RepID=UPI00106CDC70|nr:uncharacterized protein LOC114530729 isoform X2 [Dendronephthya gigantea]